MKKLLSIDTARVKPVIYPDITCRVLGIVLSIDRTDPAGISLERELIERSNLHGKYDIEPGTDMVYEVCSFINSYVSPAYFWCTNSEIFIGTKLYKRKRRC